VDLRAGLDNVEKRIFLTLPGLELKPLGSHVASRYTDCAIPALLFLNVQNMKESCPRVQLIITAGRSLEGGGGRIAPGIFNFVARCRSEVIIRPQQLYPQGNPNTSDDERPGGQQVSLDVFEKSKISFACREPNPESSASSPQPRYYTD
jgi:hypothetical protein